MKEHETVWPCMPNGPFENPGTGLMCTLCGSHDPGETHMAGHCIENCGDTSTKPRSFSRRINLEKHLLQYHAVPPHRTRDLADKWRTTFPKHFACGFCVCAFPTIHEQLNHIDIDHFRKGQQITEWNATTVIQSLLLSLDVAILFQEILLRDPYAVNRDPHWHEHMTEELQKELEIAEDAAKILACEAYGMLTSNLSWRSSCGHPGSTSPPGMDSSEQSDLTMSPFAPSTKSPENNSDRQMEYFTQSLENPSSAGCDHVAAPPISCPMPDDEFPVYQSDEIEATNVKGYQTRCHAVSKDFAAVNTGSAAPSEAPYFQTRTGSRYIITESSCASPYDSLSATTHWRAVSSTTPNSLHSTGAPDMPKEQPRTYGGPIHGLETARMPTFDLKDVAESHSSEEIPPSLDIRDGGQIRQWGSRDQMTPHYDMNVEPEQVRNVLQFDKHYPMEPLTCDPRDLVK